MSNPRQDAIETIRSFMDHIRSGEFDEAKALFSEDVETMPLPEAGENETLTYTLGDAMEEGETVVVPVELSIESSDAQGAQEITFVCVNTDAGMRIDMDLTLKKTMGASPDELAEAMKETFEGVKEDLEDLCEEAAEEEPYDQELYDHNSLSDEFKAGLTEVEDELEDEIESIMDSLENEDIVWEIAWGTMNDDKDCPLRLVRSVFVPLRTALSFLEDHRSEDPEEKRGASIDKVRASIQKIRIYNVNDYRLCDCTLKDGRLTLQPCLIPGDNPSRPVQGFDKDDIEWAIRDSLDLDVGPAIKQSKAAVVKFIDKCRKDIGFEPTVKVDWESFRAIDGGQNALAALKRFRNDLLGSVHYSLFHLKRKVPFEACLKSIHFQHVDSIEERTITVDGMQMNFYVPMVERSSCYSDEEIEKVLADLVNELPLPQAEETAPVEPLSVEETEDTTDDRALEPEEEEEQEKETPVSEPPVNAFQQQAKSMETDMLPPMRQQMTNIFGKKVGMEVDWDSMEEDQDHFNLVISGVMGSIMGALMTMAYDPVLKEPLTAAISDIRMKYDDAVQGFDLALNNGVLTVSCGGPSSEYTQDPIFMAEKVKELLKRTGTL